MPDVEKQLIRRKLEFYGRGSFEVILDREFGRAGDMIRACLGFVPKSEWNAFTTECEASLANVRLSNV